MDLGLKGKIAMVTGAAGGIGAAIGRAFYEEGAVTIFSDVDGPRLKEAVKNYGKRAIDKVFDVSDRNSVNKLFKSIEEEFGKLHVLVNNAAVNTAGYIEQIKEEDIEKVFKINMLGYVYTTMAALPLMKRTGYGRLIYINSGSGIKASAGLPLYSSAKYFNRGFAISAALEAGKYNITSNSICPSDVYPEEGPGLQKEMSARSWTNESLLRISMEKEGVGTLEDLMQKRIRSNPMRRSCKKEDVASLALFLAGDKAGFINGQSIGLNGGSLPF
jgi:NAD(P)-dependent dehydrogenase (short-subunit alcohol dehydrogenase family)